LLDGGIATVAKPGIGGIIEAARRTYRLSAVQLLFDPSKLAFGFALGIGQPTFLCGRTNGCWLASLRCVAAGRR
jgi:hypothetical protein